MSSCIVTYLKWRTCTGIDHEEYCHHGEQGSDIESRVHEPMSCCSCLTEMQHVFPVLNTMLASVDRHTCPNGMRDGGK